MVVMIAFYFIEQVGGWSFDDFPSIASHRPRTI